jgi:hypothetical protein
MESQMQWLEDWTDDRISGVPDEEKNSVASVIHPIDLLRSVQVVLSANVLESVCLNYLVFSIETVCKIKNFQRYI